MAGSLLLITLNLTQKTSLSLRLIRVRQGNPAFQPSLSFHDNTQSLATSNRGVHAYVRRRVNIPLSILTPLQPPHELPHCVQRESFA